MRKGISIVFALAMILCGAQYTIATHFCGGEIAGTKVSLSGKLASCGMEGTEESCPSTGSHITNHCCDDKVATVRMVNIYTAPVSLSIENPQNILQVFYVPVSQSVFPITSTKTLFSKFNPPGGFPASAVDLDDICTFRI